MGFPAAWRLLAADKPCPHFSECKINISQSHPYRVARTRAAQLRAEEAKDSVEPAPHQPIAESAVDKSWHQAVVACFSCAVLQGFPPPMAFYA